MIDWDAVCEGLVEAGICGANAEADLYHVEGRPLLNGMFGVSKGEMEMGHDVHRLIMNLVPLNNICRGIQGDVATLHSMVVLRVIVPNAHRGFADFK